MTSNQQAQEYNLPKHEDFLDCMVAFVDILGFDARVRAIRTEEDFNKVGKLISAIKETADNFNKNKGLFKQLTITDNI